MLSGGDDISNDVITLGTYFAMFVYIRTRFHFALIHKKLTAQSTGRQGGIGVEYKFQRSICKPSFLLPPRHLSLLADYDYTD